MTAGARAERRALEGGRGRRGGLGRQVGPAPTREAARRPRARRSTAAVTVDEATDPGGASSGRDGEEQVNSSTSGTTAMNR